MVQNWVQDGPVGSQGVQEESQEVEEEWLELWRKLSLHHLPHPLQPLLQHLLDSQDIQSLPQYDPADHHSRLKAGQEPSPENDDQVHLHSSHHPEHPGRGNALLGSSPSLCHQHRSHQPPCWEVYPQGVEKEEENNQIKVAQSHILRG